MKNLIKTTAVLLVSALITYAPVSAAADEKISQGTFTGENDHVTTGGIEVIKTADGGAVVILDSDFSLDGAPDPRVGFGIDGKFVAASDLGELQSKTGKQVYVVPAGINVDDFNEVYIWCLKFGVSLGVAPLS